jgi:16S rRNA (guanine(966)-N(2))-methyltransferase RsmD
MDKMRESVFAILGGRLGGASFLDLFSGSGIIGIEAWSRGAGEVVLVEKDPGKKQILLRNAELAEGHAKVHIMPVERYIKYGKEGPFDFIFLDPPFPYRFKTQLLEMIAASRLLGDGGIVLIHHPQENDLPEEAGNLKLSDKRAYGRSVVRFYRRTAYLKMDNMELI